MYGDRATSVVPDPLSILFQWRTHLATSPEQVGMSGAAPMSNIKTQDMREERIIRFLPWSGND